MAVIVVYNPTDPQVADKVTEYHPSAHTPDFDSEPNKVTNPDLSLLIDIVPVRHWKFDGVSDIVEMLQAEKDIIDAQIEEIRTFNEGTSGAPLVDAIIRVDRGSAADACLRYDETVDLWKIGLFGADVEVSDVNHNHDLVYLQDITAESIKELSDVRNPMTPTDGQVLTWNNANSEWEAQTETHDVIVKDEGVAVTGSPFATLNFLGAGVTAVDGGSGEVDITITGAGSSGWTDDGTVVRLTTAGDQVSIGTASPGADSILEVRRVSIGTTNHVQMIVSDGALSALSAYNLNLHNDSSYVLMSTEDGVTRQATLFASDGATGNNTIFGITTSSNSGSSWNPQFVVSHDGGVGIGKNAPTEVLDVAGNLTAEGTIISTGVIAADDNISVVKSTSTTSWTINAGRTGFFDNWILFKNSAEASNFTFAITDGGVFRGKDGVAGAPTYSYDSASNYGMSYDPGANEGLVLSTEGFARLRIEDDGTLSVIGTANYETLVTADDDIPNKKYVDDEVAGAGGGSAPLYFSGVDTVGGVDCSSGWTDLPLDTEHVKSGLTHAASSAEVTIDTTRVYEIVYNATLFIDPISIDRNGGEARLMLDTGAGYAEVAGTRRKMYLRDNAAQTHGMDSCSCTVFLSLTATDKLKFQVQRLQVNTGTIETVANGSGLSIHSIT